MSPRIAHELKSHQTLHSLRQLPIRLSAAEGGEEMAQAWVNMLGALERAQAAFNEAADCASVIAELEAQCETGDEEACEELSQEDEAKKQWLSRVDVPALDSAAKAIAQVSAVASARESRSQEEDEAKKAWLKRLDAPTWDEAAEVVKAVASDATEIAQLDEECATGDDEACDELSREDDAKISWIAQLDEQDWSAVATSVTQAAAAATNFKGSVQYRSRFDPKWR